MVYTVKTIYYGAVMGEEKPIMRPMAELMRLSEEELIQHAQAVLDQGSRESTVSKTEYEALFSHYTKLRDQAAKLTRISDKMQKKLIETNILVRQKVDQLTQAEEKLQQLSITDILTNLPNRRGAYLYLDELERQHRRNNLPFTIFLVDIDHYKTINDNYGHHAGDLVLVRTAVAMRSAVREQDFLGRWGGDEFIIVLPETDSEGARVVAEKVRQRVAAERSIYEGTVIGVTISLGGGQYADITGRMHCLENADKALYRSKANGRNRVEL